jgi:hypothetical protein
MKMMTPKQIILCKKCQHLISDHDNAIVLYDEERRAFSVAHRHSCVPATSSGIHRFDLLSLYECPGYYRALYNCEIMNGNLEQDEVAYLLWLIYQDYDAKDYFDFSEEEYQRFYKAINEQVDL